VAGVIFRTTVFLSVGLMMTCSAAFGASPWIVAHRGASHDAPENTVAAFKLAWEQGADAIEGDFYLTRDRHIVCIHDADTKRVAGEKLSVAQSSLAELRRLDVGMRKGPKWQGERIPTIDEVLATIPPNKRIFLEIKSGPEIIGPLKEAIARAKLRPEQATFIAFQPAVVAEAKRQLPQVKAFWLTGFKQDKETCQWKPSVEEVLATLDRIHADGVDCNAHDAIDRCFVDAIREATMEFHVWTVDDPAVARRFVQLGVDSITTNRPAWLRQSLSL
jgi:glycerophosphoryl diester phosphodiesterase